METGCNIRREIRLTSSICVSRRPARLVEPALALIDAFERAIVQAHDEKATMGVPADEVARQRPDVEALAGAVAARLREEHRAHCARTTTR